MIKIAICDDELEWKERATEQISEYFEKHSDIPVRISSFSTGEELLEGAALNGSYDIYIIDIIMPEENGIVLAEKLRENNDNGIIIFLTTSRDFAVDSYSVDAFNYLLKPINTEALYAVLKKASDKIQKRCSKSILIKTKYDTRRLNFDDIYYVELVRKSLCFHMINGETVVSTSQRISFMEAVAQLFTDDRFAPCGASFAINLFYIKSIEKNNVIFTDETILEVPKKAGITLKTKWLDYWFKE